MGFRYFFFLIFPVLGCSSHETVDLYINLMKKIVANTIYEDPSFQGPYNSQTRENGQDWPKTAHTMIGIKRLDNIHNCLEDILHNHIPGDCIETGVWRGGATILMRAILKAHGDTSRKIWVADSFSGLPPPNVMQYPADRGLNLYLCRELAVSSEEVRENFKKYDLLDEQVVFLKGLFRDTLPTAPIAALSLLRLDGDLYESTMDSLTSLYPKLSLGGYVIIDDYYAISACAKAVEDYRSMNGISEPLQEIDHTAIFWKRVR